jgi:hypothetical protein
MLSNAFSKGGVKEVAGVLFNDRAKVLTSPK